MLHPYDLEGIPPNMRAKCRHSIVDRRLLRGERDYETLRGVKCCGNQHLIPFKEGNGGTNCTACSTNFCRNPRCICKSS